METKLYGAREGYNIIASHYNDWKWQNFWHLNEYPLVEKWCAALAIGEGLDMGAGSGNSLSCFLGRGHRVTAVDISPGMLKICRDNHRESIEMGQLNCLEWDLQRLPSKKPVYDWVISNRVLSNVEDAECMIRRISGLIKPGGQCFISDVHPLHCYTKTKVSVGDNEVCIRTFKHRIKHLKSLFVQYGFTILRFEEIGIENLCNKTALDDLPRLKGQQAPIFYYTILRRD